MRAVADLVWETVAVLEELAPVYVFMFTLFFVMFTVFFVGLLVSSSG